MRPIEVLWKNDILAIELIITLVNMHEMSTAAKRKCAGLF